MASLNHSRSSRLAGVLAAAGALALFAGSAFSQVTPDRLYYGIGRAVPMKIEVPKDSQGEVKLELIAPVTNDVVQSAGAAAGEVNLAEKFPTLWTTSDPRLLYLQLSVGDKRVGAPVVLQALVGPKYAARVDGAGNPTWQASPKTYSGIRAYVDKHVVFDTTKGEIEIKFRPDMAPNTVWNFRGLTEGGFYTDIVFHRVADLSGDGTIDILQVGDPGAGNPATAGSGGPGYCIDLEPSTLAHDLGIISMARTPDPNSNGSQIFLCLNKNGTSFLDGKYTTFGETVRGTDVLKLLAAVPINPQNSRPIDPPMIKSGKLVDAPPIGAPAADAKKPGETPAEKR